MGLVIGTTSEPPVTVEELQEHLRIDDSDSYGVLYALRSAAVRYVEAETRQQLSAEDAVLTLDAFPAGREIRLPKPPLQSVESIQYRDTAGTLRTLSASAYSVDTTCKPGRIVLAPS